MVRMRLVRDNDDPRLLADLDRLAGREPEILDDVPAAGAEVAEGDGDPPVEPGPLDDTFVLRFVQVSVHVKRYLPFYIGAAAWALTMLLIQPMGDDRDGPDDFAGRGLAGSTVGVAPASSGSAVADLNADAIGAPTFEVVTGAAFAEGPGVSFDDTEFALSGDDASTDPADAGTAEGAGATFESDEPIDFGDDEFGEEPDGFTIVRSGYASATGGTPAEQPPPDGGLPVAVTLGNDTKRSFIELAGSGATLMLKQMAEGAIQPEDAVVKACVLDSADWKAERGQSLQDSPTFAPACATGARSGDVWTFDLSSFRPEDLERGLALTGGPGTAHTFEIAFEPLVVEPEGA